MQDATKTSGSTSARSDWPTSAKALDPGEARRAQREKILQATIDLVSKRGYNDTSVERICKQAGVSFPTFRNHYRDKEEAFLAAFDQTVEEARERVVEAMSAAGEKWPQRVAAAIGEILEVISEDPGRARLCLVEALTAGAAGIDRYEATVRLCIPGLLPGREQGGADQLPALLEETITGGVAWSIHQKVARGEAGSVAELLPGLLETVLTPYLGERKAKALAERPSATK